MDDGGSTLSLLTVAAPEGLASVAAGTPLVPLFSTPQAARAMDIDPARCVRPQLSALLEILDEKQHVVIDAGDEPTLVLQIGQLASAEEHRSESPSAMDN